MRTFDLGIIGGGIMGASAALHAARRGARVVLIDQGSLPNPRGASVDHSKVFRYAYPDPLYVRLAMQAHALWRDLERETGRQLLVPTGLVLLGQGAATFENACFDALRECECATECLTSADAQRRWPQLATSALSTVIFDPSGALARAEDAVRATLDLARRSRVTLVEDDRVIALLENGIVAEHAGKLTCGKTLVAAGPWSRQVLPELAPRLRVTRQEALYFEPSAPEGFTPDRFPIFLDLASGFYGFPVHHGGAMKIANHQKGAVADPDQVDPRIADEPAARGFFRRFIPGLADARLVETRVCHYNNTPDDDFIIDWLPGRRDVLIATGFSGHGFKFGAAIGRICAELVTTGRSTFPLERFALRRFAT